MDDQERDSIRAHLELVEALVLAASRRREVLEVVGRAEHTEEAQAALQELLGIGEVPAMAVLDAQIRRFTSHERDKLISMRDELRRQVAGLE